MRVEARGNGQQKDLGFEEAILKLYDRRFAAQLRDDHDVEPWSESNELAYKVVIDSGHAIEFSEELARGEFGDTDAWSTGENETYLQDLCKAMFEAETSLYTTLQDYQRKEVPRLFAPITIDTALVSPAPLIEGTTSSINSSDIIPSTQERTRRHTDFLHIKGILVEYVPGLKFSQLTPQAVPKSAWQNLVDQAIRTANILGDHNILNEDVRPDNLLSVRDLLADCGYRAVMINFGYCRLRADNESGSDWGRAKQREDEEGAVGQVMQRILGSNMTLS